MTAVSRPATSSAIGTSNAEPALSDERPRVLLEALEPRPELVGADPQIREAEAPVGVGGRLDRDVGVGLARAHERAGHRGALRIEHPAADRAPG